MNQTLAKPNVTTTTPDVTVKSNATTRSSTPAALLAAAAAAVLAVAGAATVALSADRPAAAGKSATRPAAAGGEAAAKPATTPANLARGKPVTASSAQDGHDAGQAVDGDADTRWCAEDGEFPQWLQVDLGGLSQLTGCRILWEFGDLGYHYKIEGSPDGQAWSMLVDHLTDGAADLPDGDRFAAKSVRHVRVTVTRANPGGWASLKELQVFGTAPTPGGSGGQAKPAGGAGAKKADAAPSPNSVKAPPGWDVTIFAAPPQTNYPTTVCAMPNGDVFVGIDEMGSLGREKGRGRVDRLRDTDGDGKADQIVTVAKMDYPRGVWADGKDLYVLHPPVFEKYTDDTGDGVADRSEVLVRGISTEETLKNRGPDHTTNGFRVGPDGWAYIAVGDFGAHKAVGKDGAELRMHGGGVARVRLDGTGLEMYSIGQRNIYDVAVDPFGRCFTRDNTNDGGGWNVRISHVAPTGNYGYPRLFARFGDEIVQPLNDYGGGSPCGALWVDEADLPDVAQGLLTVEWGASKVFRHPVVAEGAGYASSLKQEVFLDLQRPTDIDYDGRGNFYVTSWANGGFSYSGPNVGYVAKVSPRGDKPAAFADVTTASDADLLGGLSSPSMKVRELAQREIIRRGDKPALVERLLERADHHPYAQDLPHGAQVRAAVIFTLRQVRGSAANEALSKLAGSIDGQVREVALRALADKVGDATAPLQPFLAGLKDQNPRIRLVAAWGAGRLGRPEAAAAVLPLAGDDDPLVRHVAVNALVALKAADVCLGAVGGGGNAKVASGALLALQRMHHDKVVDGLAAKLGSASLGAATRSAVYRALCRLHFKEADWDGTWWGTRPDTSGPYYKTAEWAGTAKVRAVLEGALAAEKPETVRQLVIDMQRHKIVSPAVQAFVATHAKTDPAFRTMLLDQLATSGSRDAKLTADQVALLKGVAVDDKAEPAQRATAIRALARDVGDAAALDATVDALAAVAAADAPAKELADLLDEAIRDAKYAGQIPYFAKLAAAADAPPAKREVGYAVLVSVATSRLTKPAEKEKAAKVIEAGWEKPATAAGLLRAVGRTRAGEYREMVEAMATDPNADVVRAAAYAAGRLGMKGSGVAAESREMIEKVGYEKTLELAQKEKGDAGQGKEIFARVGCVGCHTVSASEPPKGPYLGGIAGRYSRAELTESIIKPSTKIAQGFETQWFRLKGQEDDPIEGFVTREGGDDLELRNAAGVSQVIKKDAVARRGKREQSVMPEGLVNRLSPQELAHLLAYLESVKK